MNVSATAAQISGMFRHHGPKPLTVKATPRGYVATFASRADAFTAGRLVLESFAADPESGSPTVAVLVKPAGGAILSIVVDR
jgi:hypothetical protein